MHMQLINIPQRPHTMRTNKPLIRKRAHAPKNPRIPIQLDLVLPRRARTLPIIRLHGILRRARVDPLLDFDLAGAVVDLVGYVCGLGADVADLADEGYGGGVGAVDLVVCFRVGLRGVEGLFDCDWAESGVVEVALPCLLVFILSSSERWQVPFLLLPDWRSSRQA